MFCGCGSQSLEVKIAFRKLGCETSRTSRSSSFLTSRYQALAARGLSRYRCRSPERGRQGSDASASSSWPSSAYQVKDFLRLPGRRARSRYCMLRVPHASSTAIAHLRASTPNAHPYASIHPPLPKQTPRASPMHRLAPKHLLQRCSTRTNCARRRRRSPAGCLNSVAASAAQSCSTHRRVRVI